MSPSGDRLCAAPLHVLTPAPATSYSFYRCCGKRLFDVVLAGTAGLCLLPVIGITWLFVRFKLGSPAIFQQPRAGLHGGVFTLFKFRSMKEAVDQHGHPLPDEQRLTSFGQKLRSLSLDELPQLWNIVRGDMSLIGPRPLLVRYLPRYSPQQARRHEVRPGITGWAQVNGRNSIEWDEKFKLDVWYVDHCSLMLDLRILFATFASVFLRRGISSDSHVTMPEFMGTATNAAAEHTAVDANGHTH
ncbi:MAG: sugar transferase [Planctomycetales bacterium]|nr:sugar transferase [Planctomycetales bacterium]MCA9170060.1 sugar transferase [Planctomycetales bacterium]